MKNDLLGNMLRKFQHAQFIGSSKQYVFILILSIQDNYI